MTNDRGKSDSSIVPTKPSNKAEEPAAETVEGRGLAEGNPGEGDTCRTQCRESVPSTLERVRELSRRNRKQRFTALFHHVYEIDRLRSAYRDLNPKASAGVDGETWESYGLSLEENLRDLSGRLARGAYRAKPVRRAFIEKADGRLRPLGVPTLEDKIVQRATAEVLNAIWDEEFLRFSYGFRVGRGPHDALDALSAGVMTRKVGWVLDADIRGFFDTLDHGWLLKFIEHRVGDRRVVRLIRKWLNAGVLEDGERTRREVGTVQGGSISPLLANIYLHYVFDLWVQWWRRRRANGDVIVIRFADDFVVGFQRRGEAEQFLAELRSRFAEFGLELHPEKTRLIEFGRFVASGRRARGKQKPETFDFLGFTHICGKTRIGKFMVLRQTIRKRMQVKLKTVKAEIRRRMHDPVPETGRWLGQVVRGHVAYFGVPMNSRAIGLFRMVVGRAWWKSLGRRSQTGRIPWSRMTKIINRWIPPAHICHPWPIERLGVLTRGGSRMR